jgi:DNA repair exonuclease SbcCD ATPase subunit
MSGDFDLENLNPTPYWLCYDDFDSDDDIKWVCTHEEERAVIASGWKGNVVVCPIVVRRTLVDDSWQREVENADYRCNHALFQLQTAYKPWRESTNTLVKLHKAGLECRELYDETWRARDTLKKQFEQAQQWAQYAVGTSSKQETPRHVQEAQSRYKEAQTKADLLRTELQKAKDEFAKAKAEVRKVKPTYENALHKYKSALRERDQLTVPYPELIKELDEQDALRKAFADWRLSTVSAERDEARAEIAALRAERDALAEKLKALELDEACTVCYERPAEIAAVPCGRRWAT